MFANENYVLKNTKLIGKGKFISTISPSSGLAGESSIIPRYIKGKNILVDMGFNVYTAPNWLMGIKTLVENSILRANDILWSLNKDNVDILISNIGGFNSKDVWPILKHVKPNKQWSSKTFIGFSDATALHFILRRFGVKCVYGPSILDGFTENGAPFAITIDTFKKTCINKKGQYEIVSSPYWTSQYLEWSDRKYDYTYRDLNKEEHGHIFNSKGNDNKVIKGKLLGGCIDSMNYLVDQEFFPSLSDWKDKIIFFETSESYVTPDELKKIVKKLKPIINVCKGIIWGKPKDEKYFKEYLEILDSLNKPYAYNVNFGHTAPQVCLPYDGMCEIDFKNKKISIKT